MSRRYTKRAAAQFAVGLDFSTFPVAAGETLAASNAVGSLAVTATDAAGADASAAVIDGAPWISGTQVRWRLKAGAPAGWYELVIAAPTSDGELLVDRQRLEVLP